MLNFDYFIAGSWDYQFLLECVFRTLQVFTLYNFKVRVFVCDGASANLALIKLLCGYKREQLPLCDGEDPFAGQRLFKTHMKINQETREYLLLFAHLTRLSETQEVAGVNNINSLFKTAPNLIH